jgi:outer membrane protein assembly factor BamD (BamD/ComL family)
MKRIILGTFVVCLVLLMASCGSPRQQKLQEIKDIESATFSESGLIDAKGVDALIAAYESFANDFPNDSLAPNYLFKAGDVAMNTNRSNKAIELYDRIINSFGNYQKAPEALFLKGYVYENNLGRLDKAQAIYE